MSRFHVVCCREKPLTLYTHIQIWLPKLSPAEWNIENSIGVRGIRGMSDPGTISKSVLICI